MKFVYALIGVLICLMLSSCFFFKAVKTDTALSPELDGYWRTDGYSMILNIKKGKIRFYEITNVSSIEHIPYFAKYQNLKLKPINGRKMIGYIEGDAFKYYASRIHKLPFDHGFSSLFNLLSFHQKKDPEQNFEIFWHTFNENYPFFNLRNMNWQEVYTKYRRKVTSQTTEDELYQIFLEMTKPLNDPHIWVQRTPFEPKVWYESMLPDWLSIEKMNETQRTLFQLADMDGLKDGILSQTYENILFRDLIPVIKNVYLGGEYQSACNGNIFYGKLSPYIGYIFVGRTQHYLADDKQDEPEDGKKVLSDSLNQMTAYFSNSRFIIMDLRFNMGGLNAYNMEIVSRFVQDKTFIGYKEAKDINPFASKQGYYVSSKGKETFKTDQIVLLSSQMTHNAGEVLTAMMKTLPDVTTIGEKTYGALSHGLIRHLPNGWEFSLSNEKFYNADGICYEGVGIEPDILKNMNLEGFMDKKDVILDEAINYLDNNYIF